MPPESISRALPLDRAVAALVLRLPLDPEGVAGRRAWLAQHGRADPALMAAPSDLLAHELGDVRFATAFPADPHGSRCRLDSGLAVFALAEDATSLLAYGLRPLDELRAVPLPPGWRRDPIDWGMAVAAPLLPRVARHVGRAVPFTCLVAPSVRVPAVWKPPRLKGPRNATRDAAARIIAHRPGLSRAEALGYWLRARLAGAELDSTSVRVMGEHRASLDRDRWSVLGVRLNGLLAVTDPVRLTAALLAGIGRRKAYGKGLLALP